MTDAAARLCDLLVAECAALRRGAFDEVAAMVDEKTALVGTLAASPPCPDMRRRLARLAEDSARHLRAALAGIRQARARIDAAVRAAGATATYDPEGRTTQVGRHVRSFERRA